jgi:hypothetical protein
MTSAAAKKKRKKKGSAVEEIEVHWLAGGSME